MTNLEHIIQTASALGSANTMIALGITSGEISSRQALKTYGKWFRDAMVAERIRPVRVGNGSTGTKWYKVTDILTLKAHDEIKAQLKF